MEYLCIFKMVQKRVYVKKRINMTVIIPVNKKDEEDAQIVSMNEIHFWALITLEDGKIQSCTFHDTREEITQWIDIVVVLNEQEHVWLNVRCVFKMYVQCSLRAAGARRQKKKKKKHR